MQSPGGGPDTLGQVLRSFQPKEILRADLLVGLLVGAGASWGTWLSIDMSTFIAVSAGIVGVVVGAVIAGVAVIAAFLSPEFLRKLKLIGREPVRYIAPFLFTGVLGVAAMVGLLTLALVPSDASRWVLAALTGVTGLAVGWTVCSVLYDLSVLVQFVRLQEAAADVVDDVPTIGRSAAK